MPEDLHPQPLPASNQRRHRLRSLLAPLRRAWPFAFGVAAALLAVLLYGFLYPAPLPLTETGVNDIVVAVMASATPPPPFSAEVYDIILPSLVLIQSQGEEGSEEEGVGVGSGVVINEDAAILTAFHVVAGASAIEVHFADGTTADAVIISAEPENDIAVLQPSRPPEVTVPAVLGNPGTLRVGDAVAAVGAPLGLAGSLSAGVISGFNRSIPIDEEGDQRLDGLIQFDAAVNPGNSGGPLLNKDGQVVGIVTAIANPSDSHYFIGIGFAVSINTAAAAAGLPPY